MVYTFVMHKCGTQYLFFREVGYEVFLGIFIFYLLSFSSKTMALSLIVNSSITEVLHQLRLFAIYLLFSANIGIMVLKSKFLFLLMITPYIKDFVSILHKFFPINTEESGIDYDFLVRVSLLLQ